MRLWSIDLLDVLPDAQFKGQLREMVAILHDWRDKGSPNHLLINKVADYPKQDFVTYFYRYMWMYHDRYGRMPNKNIIHEFEQFSSAYYDSSKRIFVGWHNKEYMRVCMANLYEKYHFAKGRSKITDEEWNKLLKRYKELTKEDYSV